MVKMSVKSNITVTNTLVFTAQSNASVPILTTTFSYFIQPPVVMLILQIELFLLRECYHFRKYKIFSNNTTH